MSLLGAFDGSKLRAFHQSALRARGIAGLPSGLYAIGDATVASAHFVRGFSRYSGGVWTDVSDSAWSTATPPRFEHGIVWRGDQVLLCGNFLDTVFGVRHLARWDGEAFSYAEPKQPLINASGSDKTLYRMFEPDTVAGLNAAYELAIGTTWLDEQPSEDALGFALWKNPFVTSEWFGVGPSSTGGGVGRTYAALPTYGRGYALAEFGGDAYLGGDFTVLTDGTACRALARQSVWGSATLSPLSTQLDSPAVVNSLGLWDGKLLATGSFTTAGGGATTLNRVGLWDGSAWSALASGLAATAGAHVIVGGKLYVTLGSGVSQWDGVAWTSIGVFSGGSCVALAKIRVGGQERLVAGGDFTSVKNLVTDPPIPNTERVVIWDGTTWTGTGWGSLTAGNVKHLLAL